METVNNQYLGGDASLACSAETQAEIDRQVVALVKKPAPEGRPDSDGQSGEAGRDWHVTCIEKETITGEEFMQILEPSTK